MLCVLSIAPLEIKSPTKHMWWKGVPFLRGDEAQGASEEERQPLHSDEDDGGGNDVESHRNYCVYELSGNGSAQEEAQGSKVYDRQPSELTGGQTYGTVSEEGARKTTEEMLESLNRRRRPVYRSGIDRRGSGELSRLSRTSTANSSQNSPHSQSDDGSSMHASPAATGRISALDLGDRALVDDGRGFVGSLADFEGHQGRQDAGAPLAVHPSGLPNGQQSRAQFMERFQSNVHDRLDQWDSSTARELLRGTSGAASSTGTPPNLEGQGSGFSTPSPLPSDTSDAPRTLRNIPRPAEGVPPQPEFWLRSLSGHHFTDYHRGRTGQGRGGAGRDGGYERLHEGRRMSESSSRASEEQFAQTDSSKSEEQPDLAWDEASRRDGMMGRSLSSRQSSGQTSDGGFATMSRQSSGNSEGSSRALIVGGRDSISFATSPSTALSTIDSEEPSIDFKKEEENYQLQVALALRVTSEAAAMDELEQELSKLLEKNVVGGVVSAGGTTKALSQAEATSYRYWVNNSLGYDEKVVDGFYEVWGMSPAMWSMCTESEEYGRMPNLEMLRGVQPGEAQFEVIVVDRSDGPDGKPKDPDLLTLENKAIELGFKHEDFPSLARELGIMVAEHLGGVVTKEAELTEMWRLDSWELKNKAGSIVLPLGTLRIGLCRHRALLFKVLADSIGIPCRLVRGCKHCDRADSASCVVQIDDREYVVNILTKPGILDEPDGPPNSNPFHRNVTSPLFPRAGSVGSEAGSKKGDADAGEAKDNNPGMTSMVRRSSVGSVRSRDGGAAEQAKPGEGAKKETSAFSQDGGESAGAGRRAGGEVSTSGREGEEAEGGMRATPPSVRKSLIDRGAQWAESSIWAEKKAEQKTDAMSEWEIPWEELVIGERIGAGSYGKVYRADWQGSEVAVKVFLDQDFRDDAIEDFKAEFNIIRRCRHPNVVLFMGAVTKPPNLSIVTEFLQRGSLYRILHRPNSAQVLDERKRMRMALDVAKGMNYLHRSSPPIVHRDLKSPNLLVDKNWTVKVCDFGLSRLKNATFLTSKSSAGTPEWMAPEVLKNEPSDEKADVYSFGVILWELITLEQPWNGLNPMQVVGAVGFQERRLQLPDNIDPDLAKLITSCWHTVPKERPSFAEIMQALKPLQGAPAPKASGD